MINSVDINNIKKISLSFDRSVITDKYIVNLYQKCLCYFMRRRSNAKMNYDMELRLMNNLGIDEGEIYFNIFRKAFNDYSQCVLSERYYIQGTNKYYRIKR